MKKLLFLLSVLILCGTIKAQEEEVDYLSDPPIYEPKTFPLQPINATSYADPLKELLREYQLYQFHFEELYEFANSTEYVVEFKLQIQDKSYLITLQRNDLRAPNYQLAVNGQTIYNRADETDDMFIVETFKGFANRNPDNIVRVTITPDFFAGCIYDAELEEWLFFDAYTHLTNDYSHPNTVLVLHRDIDMIQQGACQLLEHLNLDDVSPPPSPLPPEPCQPLYLKIATDADYECYKKRNNNFNKVNTDIRSVLNTMEGLYGKYFNMSFVITFQNVWSISTDPYNSEINTGRLKEFENAWDVNFKHITRDYTILFTGIYRLINEKTGIRNNNGVTRVGTSSLNPGSICRYPQKAYSVVANE